MSLKMIPPGPFQEPGKLLGDIHQKSLVGVPKYGEMSGVPRATSVEEDVEWFVSQTPEDSDRDNPTCER